MPTAGNPTTHPVVYTATAGPPLDGLVTVNAGTPAFSREVPVRPGDMWVDKSTALPSVWLCCTGPYPGPTAWSQLVVGV